MGERTLKSSVEEKADLLVRPMSGVSDGLWICVSDGNVDSEKESTSQ